MTVSTPHPPVRKTTLHCAECSATLSDARTVHLLRHRDWTPQVASAKVVCVDCAATLTRTQEWSLCNRQSRDRVWLYPLRLPRPDASQHRPA